MNEYKLSHYKKIETELESEITELKDIIFGSHLSDIIRLKIEFQEIIKTEKDNTKLLRFIDDLLKKEKVLFAKTKKKQDPDNIPKLVKMESELTEIKRELYYMEKG